MLSFIITLSRFFRSLYHGFKEPEFRALAVIVLILLGSGSFFYHEIEHWRLLDALYFCVTTLATVGGSGLAPQTDIGKMFTILYIFLGLGSVFAFITAVARQTEKQYPSLDKIVDKVLKRKW